MSDVQAHPEDNPTTLPFQPSTEPTEHYEIHVPPSASPQFLDFRYYDPSRAALAMASPGQTPVVLSTGAVLLLGFRTAAPGSSLLAGGA